MSVSIRYDSLDAKDLIVNEKITALGGDITNLTTGTLNATGVTPSSMLVTADLASVSATIPNFVATNISSGTLDITGITASNTLSTNATITNIQTSNINTTRITCTSLTVPTGTVGSLFSDTITVDSTGTSAFDVRKNSGGASVLTVDTTNTKVQFADTNFYATYDGTNPTMYFDSNSYIKLTRAANTFDIYTGGVIGFTIDNQFVTSHQDFNIANADEAVSSSNGGAFECAGGGAVAKKLFVGGNTVLESGLSMQSGSGVDCTKFYSYSGSVSSNNGVLVLSLDNTDSHYYIKVVATLQETSDAQNISTLQFESTGAAASGDTLLSIWNTSVNNPTNSYPWSTTVTTSVAPSYQFLPNVGSRSYEYNIFIQLVGTASVTTLSQDAVTVKTWTH